MEQVADATRQAVKRLARMVLATCPTYASHPRCHSIVFIKKNDLQDESHSVRTAVRPSTLFHNYAEI